MRLKFVGYDRAYDLHPSLLARRFLIEQVKLLVEDIFQVQKHKEECCLPSNNPKCRYHPHLETFKDIRGTNTESAEQRNHFQNRFKHMCNGIADFNS